MVLVRLIALVAAILASSLAYSDPFSTTDQNPLLNGFGIPTPFAALINPAGTSTVSGTLNWSSTAIIQRAGQESLTVDAEGRDWRFAIEHSFADHFAARIEIPYRQIGGGSLDSFIEHWHSFFGLPKGDRPSLPRNAYDIDYRRSNQSLARFTSPSNGVGDIALSMGYQLGATPRGGTSLWLSLKLPTGDDELLGSGAADASVSVAHELELSRRWSAFSEIDGVYLGQGRLLTGQQRRYLINGLFGIDFRYSDALQLTVQFNGHTAAFKDSGLDLLGNAWIMTIGGQYSFAKTWRAQFGVSEDIKVDASPDVVFVFGVAKSWK